MGLGILEPVIRVRLGFEFRCAAITRGAKPLDCDSGSAFGRMM